jgi:intracellular septation protein A
VNKSFLKFVTDFGPLAIFFFYYYSNDKNLAVAIPPLIVATLIALGVVWFFEKKIPPMPLLSGILITFFGGLTIYFNDPIFIYVKPTIINIVFALALFFGKYFTNEPILKKIMGKSIPLTDIRLMRNNLRLVVNNPHKQIEEKHFFEKEELQVILDLYAKMVSEGSWKDYGLSISSKQVSFSVFRNAAENALYKICKNFKPKNKNLKYLITDTTGKILKNSFDLKSLLKNTNWKKL